jgi:iron complex transport system ATP-binding protein
MTADAAHPLRFIDVRVRYPQRTVHALDGVSLDVLPGKLTAVVGPNGSGKSTLVRALLGRIPLASGTIELNGESVRRHDARRFARSIAVVPQREEPSSPLLVRELIALGRYAHRGPFHATTTEDRQAIDRAIQRADVSDMLDRRIDELSGGEWQRVRIARALAQESRILVLDEPTTFLDVGHEMAVFELVDALAAEGRAVLLVSHQLNLVARFAAQIVLLHEGRVAASGSVHDVMRGEILERVYHWPLVVTRDPAIGAPALLPLRSRSTGGRA